MKNTAINLGMKCEGNVIPIQHWGKQKG